MGINTEIMDFKSKLADVINNSKIPPIVKYLILSDFTAQLGLKIPAVLEAEKQLETKLDETKEGGKQDVKEICKTELATSSVNGDPEKCD